MTEPFVKPDDTFNPHDIDVFGFARGGCKAEGALCATQLPRLSNEIIADHDQDTVFTWRAEGMMRPELQENGADKLEPYLRLSVQGAARLECQRCLEPYEQLFHIDAVFRLVESEAQAERYSHDDSIDAIVGSSKFNLVDLVEEELLLAFPLVPKHSVCPQVHESLISDFGVVGANQVHADELDSETRLPSLFEAFERKGLAPKKH